MRHCLGIALVLLGAVHANGEIFDLWYLGLGPVQLETTLTFQGRGERLVATAINNTGDTIKRARICVTAESKTCLFELWNTADWEAGAKLQWDLKLV